MKDEKDKLATAFLIHPSAFLLHPFINGRRALHEPAKGNGQRSLEDVQVIMPERVTIKRVRIPFAVSLRFPGEGKSAQG
jgi:hypothetical protein